MILILSHSLDSTTDIIVEALAPHPVFRWNIDLWQDYRTIITPLGFQICDPEGRKAVEDETYAVYLRKLFFNPCQIDIPQGGNAESWRRSEIEAIWLGMRDLAQEQGKLALVHPAPSGRWGKIRQMRVASEFFKVPEWWIHCGNTERTDIRQPVVAKTFSGANLEGGLVTVQEVDPLRLSIDYPWFLQTKLAQASHDVTVVWVDGELFAYDANRQEFCGDDVRASGVAWQPTNLAPAEASAIRAFMNRTGYSFSRLDFLRMDGELWFLEVNPNGQFAWLDIFCSNGLVAAVANSIIKTWELNRGKKA